MSRIQLIIGSVTFVVTSIFITPPAEAVQRTHVSAAFGNDANTATNCTAATPCRFFQAAMSVTDNNGEVIVLDSGGYGAVTITQSLALIAPTGVYAGISVFPGADGVTIATPGVNVVLRGLSINGQGGDNGINMTAGNSLTVENCVISNLQRGISVNTAARVLVSITDSIIRRNNSGGILLQNGVNAAITRAVVSGNNGGPAILVRGSAAGSLTIADIADSTFDGSFQGVYAYSFNATATVRVSVRDSRAVGNTGSGLFAESVFGGAVNFAASNNIVASNFGGIRALGVGSVMWASGNTVSNNFGPGLINEVAVFTSAGNNAVYGNAANVGTITVVATQ
jgi:hypothetical protein